MRHLIDEATEEYLPSRQLKWLVTVLLFYFGLRLLFFAIKVSPFVPPDEVTHFGISGLFSRGFLLPENSPESYQYGLVTNIPWLYYWIMGKASLLNFTGMSDLVFLRILNIPFAFGTIFFAWRTLRLLTDGVLSHALLIVAMTNTIMFSFLSATVSYDNLTNLLAAMAVYYLLAFFQSRSGNLLAASLICQLAGCLTKSAFLPLVLILNALLLIHEFRNLILLPSELQKWFYASLKRSLGLASAIILGLVLNIQLYGGNYIHFRSLAPDMADVLSPEIAMLSRIDARNLIFSQFKKGVVSKEQALEMTSYIGHSGDRSDAIELIENYDYVQKTGEPVIGLLTYMLNWVCAMLGGIFGIYAHIIMSGGLSKIILFLSIVLLAVVAFLLRWRPRESGWLPVHLGVISSFYGFFLMYAVNYATYLEYRVPSLALQGRYIFPVIGPIYVFLSYYLIHLAKGRSARIGIFLTLALIFIISDFPYFIYYASPDWFAWPLR